MAHVIVAAGSMSHTTWETGNVVAATLEIGEPAALERGGVVEEAVLEPGGAVEEVTRETAGAAEQLVP